MKNTPLILSIIAVAISLFCGLYLILGSKKTSEATESSASETTAVAQKGAIVYYNMDKVISDYDMANDLRSVVETKVEGISAEITKKGNKLQKDVNTFQDKINKGLITSSIAQVQGEKLQKQQNEFNQYAAQKQQEIAEEQQVMLNKIGDAIKTFIDKYNAEKKYALIIATQGDILPAPVTAGDPAFDITEDIIKRLNEEYVKNKNKKN